MSAIPTVKIRAGDSFALINEEDYDEAIHKLWEYVNSEPVNPPITGTSSNISDFEPAVHELWSPDTPPIEQPQTAPCAADAIPGTPEALAAGRLLSGPTGPESPDIVESDESYEASAAIFADPSFRARHGEPLQPTIEAAPARRSGWPKGKKRRP